VKWVRERAEVELDETAKGVRATGTVEDITDLKRAEEKLRESEERYRSLVESSTDAIMMLDHDENVITCNQAFLDLFGYQKEEIVGKAIRIIHPSDESAQKFRETHYQTLEGTGSVRTEWEYVRKDGTSFPAELVISLISSIEGTIIGCISIIRDITERKQADEKLKASFERLRKSLESTVSALASALEIRDPYTAGHQHRVTDLACAIADEMGLTEEQINGIRMAGLIHDIGKISIPAEILNKPGQLTEIEYTLFKNHPQVAHDVLQTVEFPWPVAQIVLQHHERFDGSGYPQGLAGKEILLESRILAVADIVEAIASHRPYRPARGAGDALEEILHNKGTLYDPEVVDACLRVFYEKGFTFEELAKLEAPLPKIH
jgi:PAS domain S-box-containing protein/putative nucleotidyltransferase with HDIG domain